MRGYNAPYRRRPTQERSKRRALRFGRHGPRQTTPLKNLRRNDGHTWASAHASEIQVHPSPARYDEQIQVCTLTHGKPASFRVYTDAAAADATDVAVTDGDRDGDRDAAIDETNTSTIDRGYTRAIFEVPVTSMSYMPRTLQNPPRPRTSISLRVPIPSPNDVPKPGHANSCIISSP